MTKIHAYTIVHYGKDYIGYALKSVSDYVDKIHVFYTPLPSHGHTSQAQVPETAQEILDAIESHISPRKFVFRSSPQVTHEGQHRDWAVSQCAYDGADLILVVDCDEVWPQKTLEGALEMAASGSASGWLVNFTHLWKSFGWACQDEAYPVRILDLKSDNGSHEFVPKENGMVYHFGYAIRDEIMRYKWTIHGHRADLRQDWFRDYWDVWPPKDDCHPTNVGFWVPQEIDRMSLPSIMQKHPFYNLEVIK